MSKRHRFYKGDTIRTNQHARHHPVGEEGVIEFVQRDAQFGDLYAINEGGPGLREDEMDLVTIGPYGRHREVPSDD